MELNSSDEEDKRGPSSASASACKPIGHDQPHRLGLRSTFARRMEGYKVAYPSRDDPDAVEILHSDLQRLAPLEFLNDTLIDFYIKYDSLSPTSLLQTSSLQGQMNKFSSADEGINRIKLGIYSALIGGC
jgi:hypothetical protein